MTVHPPNSTAVLRGAATAALALLVAAPAIDAVASTTASKRRHSACQRLKGRDLAPARTVKLVTRPNGDDGSDLVGCVLPRGRVRRLAASADFSTSSSGFDVRQVAGAIVLYDTASGSQYGDSTATTVTDLRSGRSYRVARSCFELAPGFCGGTTQNTTASAAFVNRRGQAAAAVTADGGDTITILGFSREGASTALDAGPSGEVPASSLRLAGSTVSWTHAGEPRSAELPS